VTTQEAGKLGGERRAQKLSKARREAIARYAAYCRWGKKRASKKGR